MIISELLQESMSLHNRAKVPGKLQPRAYEAMDLWRQAYELRALAESMDPEKADPAWAEEQRHTPRGRDTHDELMTFYREKLG